MNDQLSVSGNWDRMSSSAIKVALATNFYHHSFTAGTTQAFNQITVP